MVAFYTVTSISLFYLEVLIVSASWSRIKLESLYQSWALKVCYFCFVQSALWPKYFDDSCVGGGGGY